jgi:hypothetical protein
VTAIVLDHKEAAGGRHGEQQAKPVAGVEDGPHQDSSSYLFCRDVLGLAAIALHLGLNDRASHWANAASSIQNTVLEQAWSDKRGSFTAGFGVDELDASVLLLPEIGLM